jgi:hypothetical protein
VSPLLDSIGSVKGFGFGSFVPSAEIPGSFDALSAVNLTTTTASVTLSSIPGSYRHLQLRGIARSNAAGAGGNAGIYVQFNGDTGSSYSFHYFLGSGSGNAGAAALSSQTSMFTAPMNPRAGDTANMFGSYITDIFDYSSGIKNKTVSTLAGSSTNNSTAERISLNSGLWRSTTPITSITLYMEGDFAANSRFALYGVN